MKSRVYIVETLCHLTVRVGGPVNGHVVCVLSKGMHFDEIKRQRIYAEIIRDSIKREARP